MRIQPRNYTDFITRMFNNPMLKENFAQDVLTPDEPAHQTRNITFQITDDCCCACTYCYQINKGHRYMSKETAKKAVDLLFNMWYEDKQGAFINKQTKAIVLEFIGGEPLMNIELIDYTCTYFYERAITEHHPWAWTWRASLISNGAYYFKPEWQAFLKKFERNISFSITLDGPKAMHDSCRVYPDGSGNFEDAFKAFTHYRDNFSIPPGTKVTIAKENLQSLSEIVKFYYDELAIDTVYANTAYEPDWSYEDAKLFYKQLKILADDMLARNSEDLFVSLFDDSCGRPLSELDNTNWCGGTGLMLSVDPDGDLYPCIRYMASSLGGEQKPIKIGSVNTGLATTVEEKSTVKTLLSVTRRSQSTDECFNCPIAKGCAWCSAYNYQVNGTVNKRVTKICPMHKARVLANSYYWNKLYLQRGEHKYYKINLPEAEALKIVTEIEWEQLKEIEKQAITNFKTLIVICGQGSSGKTTYSNLLLDKYCDVFNKIDRVSMDDFPPETVGSAPARWDLFMDSLIDSCSKNNNLIICDQALDNIFYRKKLFNHLVNCVDCKAINLILIYLRPPLDAILARHSKRMNCNNIAELPVANFERWYNHAELPTEDEIKQLPFNSSRLFIVNNEALPMELDLTYLSEAIFTPNSTL